MEYTCKQCLHWTLGFLRRNLHSCPQEVKEPLLQRIGATGPGEGQFGLGLSPPPGVVLQEELESVQKRAARFVTINYKYETGNMTGILRQLKWESLKKSRKDNRLILLYKGLKGKASIQVTLFPKLGVVEISTQRHFRPPLLIQMFINVASSPRLSGTPRFSDLICWSCRGLCC